MPPPVRACPLYSCPIAGSTARGSYGSRAWALASQEKYLPASSARCPESPAPMRLSTIKLSGFKSFVDPTTLHLPTNMTGIVGPNGCGKSNIIDAVRW
ncbi:AAA family ATPase, partial [Xanthomonas perforans]|uniref:AAA family ATPase n=1 Tax=Xanthomonas perforans TaxID=442694 RepID=UPI003CCF0C39